VTLNGTLTGQVSGSQFPVAITLPPGAFTALGSSTCSDSIVGTMTVNGTTMTGTLTETFSAACVGFVPNLTQVDQVTLTKQ
jgi:hypothetical protein